MRDGWEEMIGSFGDVRLYANAVWPGDPKGTVIIIHGLCEHQGRYGHVAESLLSGGYGVCRFDLRGHGRSEGMRGFYKSFHHMAADVDAVAERVKKDGHKGPVFLLGHSMGGMIAAIYGAMYPEKTAGIVLCGARTRFSQTKWLSCLPLPEAEDTYLETRFGENICGDRQVVEAYREDPLVEKRYTAGLRNSCWYGVQWLKEHAPSMTVPLLILHGGEDPLVSEAESREFYGYAGSRDKTLKIYPFLYHEILNEPCKEEILGEIKKWLDRHTDC